MEEDQNTLLQVDEAQVKTKKSLEVEADSMRWEFHDSLKWTMQVVFRVRDRVTKKEKRFYPGAIILAEAPNLFQVSPKMTQEGDHSAPNLGAST